MHPTAPVELPPEYRGNISRDAINELPIRRYEGPVHVVADPPDLARALQDLLQESVVGFDTETRPAFKAGESYLPSLVQFATANAVYLLQVQQHDLSGAIREVLSSPQVVKAGVSVAHDLRELQKLFAFDAQSIVDLGKLAARHGVQQTGVRNLAGMFLGMRIPKGAKTTNWSLSRLTPQQIAYAATDAWACRELYVRFREMKMT